MSRLGGLLLGLLVTLPLAAESGAFDTSLLAFGKSGDDTFGAWTTSASGLGLTAGTTLMRLPSGSWGVAWPAFSLGGSWAGLDETTIAGRTAGLVWQAEVPDLRLSWQTSTVTLTVHRTGGWLLGQCWRDWSAGAGGAAARADLLWAPGLDVGDLRADAWGGWVAWRDLGLAAGTAEVHTQARMETLGLRLLDATGSVSLKWLAAWARPRWSFGEWTVGADLGGFAAWGDPGRLLLERQWWEFVTTPFWQVVVRTADTAYQLKAQPGWVAVVQPTVEWTWDPWLTVSLSRCLPAAGGWELSEGTSAVSGATGGSPSSAVDPWNLWWAGVQVRVRARW